MADLPTPAEIVLAFVDAVNNRNVDALSALMTDDHTFIDSMGDAIRGRDAMRRAWIAYSVMVPDYRIEVGEILVRDNIVALFGRAGGTFSPDGTIRPENHWGNHAAWRIVTEGGKISLWQVYTDNEPIRALMTRPGKSEKAGSARSA